MNLARTFLLAFLALLGFLAWLMVKPFMQYLLLAVILAFILRPLQSRLEKYLPESLSAFLLIIGSLFLVIVPLLLTGLAVVRDAQDLAADFENSELFNATEIEMEIFRLTGRSVDIAATIESGVDTFFQAAFGNITRIVSELSFAFLGLTLMLFVAFYLVRDGPELVDWMMELSPLPPDIDKRLTDRTRSTTWAVLKGHVFVAFVQAIVAGVGLFFTGVPNYLFWTFMMIILGFVPIVGSTVVWIPASIYLFLVESPLMGALLFLWGAVVVGMVDNIVRPLAVERGSDLPPAVIIIGVTGGIFVFGVPGLFIGPIVLGVFKSMLEVFRDNYEKL